jgi:hypothetical protein
MASRPRDHRGSRTASCSSTRRNGWQLRLSTLGPPESEADHHNYTADGAGEDSVRRPRDGLNTVRPRASRSGRCVLTAPHSTLLENRRPSSKHAQTKGLTAPHRSGMALPITLMVAQDRLIGLFALIAASRTFVRDEALAQ